MFDRPDATAQANINTSWNNMLSPPSRLDRHILLAVIVENQLYQRGLTRATLHAEKSIATGHVLMDISYDEQNPANDRFEVRVYDLAWNLQRAETFDRDQILAAERELYDMYQHLSPPETQPATQKWIQVPATEPAPQLSPQQLAALAAHYQTALALRLKLTAATQPGLPATQP
jgi:hypothetical protein